MILFANDNVTVFFAILVMVLSILICFVLLWRIRVNQRKYKEESETLLDETISRNNMRQSVERYIDKVGAYGACALIYIDIDDFGGLNELFGRETCDNLLKEIALRILKVMPFKAQLSRYQNDEFMIFIKDDNDRALLEEHAQKLVDIISAPYRVMVGEDINITASLGVVSFPSCGLNFNELYNNLELSTYVSKRDGGNKFTYFYTELQAEEGKNMEFFKEVKNAIRNKEFVLYYQPIVDLEANTLFGAEALMRWNHPVQGVLPPNKFLSVLEQSGDIRWVGQWGLETLIKQFLYTQDRFPAMKLKFSLNLSTKQLLDSTLTTEFIRIVKKYNVDPSNLMLEIAEFAVYDKLGQVKTNLIKLKDYGFLVAVDGFDLDYSTMAGIERAPIDIIKLDRSFLKDMDHNFMKEKFVAMLVDFAKRTNHEVICEGVENDEMVKYIRKHNVHIAQGYYYSKPLDEDQFDEFIEGRKWRKAQNQMENLSDLPEAPSFNSASMAPDYNSTPATPNTDFQSNAGFNFEDMPAPSFESVQANTSSQPTNEDVNFQDEEVVANFGFGDDE